MAATIAKATGYDSNRRKDVHRLGSQSACVQAATWKTFVNATVCRDGSGYVEIRRGVVVYRVYFNNEDEPLNVWKED